MADVADLIRRAEEARRFRHMVDRRTFVLVCPTKHEWNIEFLRQQASGLGNTGAWVATERVLLERAIVGWSEVNTTDLVPEAAAEPLPYSSEALPHLLDLHPDWGVELTRALSMQMEARAAKKDGAAKN